jgi:hypothetical protein
MNGNLARLHFWMDLEIAITGRTIFERKLMVTPEIFLTSNIFLISSMEFLFILLEIKPCGFGSRIRDMLDGKS